MDCSSNDSNFSGTRYDLEEENEVEEGRATINNDIPVGPYEDEPLANPEWLENYKKK